jgi:hypothetical protein
MPRARTWIKDRVSARVDELLPQGDNIGGQTGIENTVPLIEDELNDAALWVLSEGELDFLLEAQVSDLKHFHASPYGEAVIDTDTRIEIDSSSLKATVIVPDNFLRFVSIRLSGWTRSLTMLYGVRDPKYSQQESDPFASGKFDKPVGFLVPFTGSYAANEQTKWTLDQTLTQAQTLSGLYDGVTPTGGTALETGDLIALTAQTDLDENGIYLVNASSTAPTKLSSDTTFRNKRMAIELYRSKTISDTLSGGHFSYIPELLPEEMPDNTLPALIDYCAYRVMMNMGGNMVNEAKIALESAQYYINSRKRGLLNDGG